jgi:hypothetical protein
VCVICNKRVFVPNLIHKEAGELLQADPPQLYHFAFHLNLLGTAAWNICLPAREREKRGGGGEFGEGNQVFMNVSSLFPD